MAPPISVLDGQERLTLVLSSHKLTGEAVTIVGDHDPALMKYFGCTRSGPRSAFESNVVRQFETMEYILDFGFDRMGANGSKVDHPVLITESFGVDAAFSYKYNQQQGVCAKDGLALCPGFMTTHVIPDQGNPPKNEQAETEEADLASNEKYSLINIPDDILTPEQLDKKKKQLSRKSRSERRQRLKQKRYERERKQQLEEEKRLENPELYLEQLHARYKDLSEKVDQQKRLKTTGGYTDGNNLSGGAGRGDRLLNAAQRERPHLLTTAAFDRGKGEDTFGARDEDWQQYKLMSKDNDDEDEAELARISSKLQDLDPTFVPKLEAGISQPAAVPCFRPLSKEDFQIVLGVERFRCPDLLFNPNWIGVDQAGLDEMAGVSIKRLACKDGGLEERLTSSILVTGGSSLFPGMIERLEARIRMIRPCGSPINIVRALDPDMDAWRGAASYALARSSIRKLSLEWNMMKKVKTGLAIIN